MTERFVKLPDDVEQLKALALAATARAERFEADASANKTEAETLQSETLSLKAKIADLMQTTAAAKAEIARLTSILKTLLRGRFGERSEKLGADETEQQSFVFEEGGDGARGGRDAAGGQGERQASRLDASQTGTDPNRPTRRS